MPTESALRRTAKAAAVVAPTPVVVPTPHVIPRPRVVSMPLVASTLLAISTVSPLLSPLPCSGQDVGVPSIAGLPATATASPSSAGSGSRESSMPSVSELPTTAWGMDPTAPRIPLLTGSDGSGIGRNPQDAGSPARGSGPGPGTSFLASLIVPGSSQWMHGQNRTYLYLGLELAGWLGFLHAHHRRGDYRDTYRDLAWTYARVSGGEESFTGGFGFYETLGRWTASGSWDTDPSAEGLQPETDPETYNGNVWNLASDLYLSGEGTASDPEAMRMALLYYQERAYPPERAWDWSGNSAELERYRDLIERSDDSFRRATVILGVVVANHLLSAVDGFLSTRISTDRAVRPTSDAHPSGRSYATRWTFELRLNPFP